MNNSLKRTIGAAHMLSQICMTNSFTQSDRENVRDAANRHGLVALGSGHWSTAFAFDDCDYVVKVCFNAETDCSLTYMAWCRANQHLPHVPKVHFLQRYKSGVYIVVLDKLTPMHGAANYDAVSAAFSRATNALYGGTPEGTEGATAAAIREFFADVAEFDLHGANAMVTEHGELVITDPISGVDSAEIKSGIDRAYGVHKAA